MLSFFPSLTLQSLSTWKKPFSTFYRNYTRRELIESTWIKLWKSFLREMIQAMTRKRHQDSGCPTNQWTIYLFKLQNSGWEARESLLTPGKQESLDGFSIVGSTGVSRTSYWGDWNLKTIHKQNKLGSISQLQKMLKKLELEPKPNSMAKGTGWKVISCPKTSIFHACVLLEQTTLKMLLFLSILEREF